MRLPTGATARSYVRPGFAWRSADCFLFDIDGTLLTTHDAVHYHAFSRAFLEVWNIPETIDGVPWHGNTDIGIACAVARRAGISEDNSEEKDELRLEDICRVVGEELQRTRANLKPEACPAIREVLRSLQSDGKLLGVATGNLECVGWAKLENCGLRQHFSFGAFSSPAHRTREQIFAHAISLARVLQPGAIIHVIGDTPSDVHAARAVGIPVIAVATGKYGFDELRALGPDMLLRSFDEL